MILNKDLNFSKIIKDELINEYTIENYLGYEYFERIEIQKKNKKKKKYEEKIKSEINCINYLMKNIKYKLLVTQANINSSS